MATSKLKFNADGSVSFAKTPMTGSNAFTANKVLGYADNDAENAGDSTGSNDPGADAAENDSDQGGERGGEQEGNQYTTFTDMPNTWGKKIDSIKDSIPGPVQSMIDIFGLDKVAEIAIAGYAGLAELAEEAGVFDDKGPSSSDKAGMEGFAKNVQDLDANDPENNANGDGNENNSNTANLPTDGTTLADAVNTTGLTSTTPSTNQMQGLGLFGPQAAPQQTPQSSKYQAYSSYIDKMLGIEEDGVMDERAAFQADQAAQNTAAGNQAAGDYENSLQFINQQAGSELGDYRDKLNTLDYIQGDSGRQYRDTLEGLRANREGETGVLTPEQTRVKGIGNIRTVSDNQKEQWGDLLQAAGSKRASELTDITGAQGRADTGYNAGVGVLDRGTNNALSLRDNTLTAADRAYTNSQAQAPGNSALASLAMLSEMAGQELTAMTGIDKANIQAAASTANAGAAAGANIYGSNLRRQTALDQIASNDKQNELQYQLGLQGIDIDREKLAQAEPGIADYILKLIG